MPGGVGGKAREGLPIPIATITKLIGPGGARAVIAESLLLKHLELPRFRGRFIASAIMKYLSNHSALGGETPIAITRKTQSKVIDLRSYRWQSHCRGLYHLPVAVN